jgi:tetrapyrrole methylase family protein/MazG family protein
MATPIAELLETIHTLRAPGGCPWDRKQTLATASRHLLEEAGELVDAALGEDPEHVVEELGDLLFMVCFCCEILSEGHPADFQAVAAAGNAKLIRRHPHVFGDRDARSVGESQERWNEIKAAEKAASGEHPPASLLKDLPASTAPLQLAYAYQKDAARAGFDWPEIDGVWRKVEEEMAELREAAGADDPAACEHEVGDLLFAVVNLARWLGVQPDLALRRANRRFRRRFDRVASRFGNEPAALREAGLDALEAAWQEAKREEAPPDRAEPPAPR